MGIQVAFPTLVLSVQPRGVEGSPYWLSLEIQSPYPFPQSGETERGLWGICWPFPKNCMFILKGSADRKWGNIC